MRTLGGKSNASECNNGYCNSGNCNSGNRNSNNCNSGSSNSGFSNSGHHNSGNFNTGHYNSGHRNPGKSNTGHRNWGDRNSGSFNWGNYNSGDFNSGNHNSGVFNTDKRPTIKMFDAPSDWTMFDWLNSEAYLVLTWMPCTQSVFVPVGRMTGAEKETYPEYKTIGGYVKKSIVTAEDRQKWWDNLEVDKDEIFRTLPNFDEEKFCECVGIERF